MEESGVRFRIRSPDADPLLLLYDGAADTVPSRIAPRSAGQRHGAIYEAFVGGAGAGQLYNWALDPARPLIDPCALALAGPTRYGDKSNLPPLHDANRGARFKSIAVRAPPPYDRPRPYTARADTVIYELHVRGFAGTYAGLVRRLPYLRDLGVTALELLPTMECDETEARGEGLVNFWGYSPLSWFAPNARYAAGADPIAEFREMVAACHEAGLQVFADVVYNHTGELGTDGPTWHHKALDRDVLYDTVDKTGCGNTVRAGHPVVRERILESLRWWHRYLGVDGFRFDLASVLAAGDGVLIREIETDPWLRDAVLIAEPWDAGGGYLVHRWPGGDRWMVWNDRFRDDVRRTWLGHSDPRALARRLTGSSDLHGAGPLRSVNFITSHDGFTLLDSVSYERRHNEANGEDNRDGHAHEVSANFGVEGQADGAAVTAARDQARKNLVATLLLVPGVPMLLAGDERGRTQQGNNNAYCQDNAISHIDWAADDPEFRDFVKQLLGVRRETAALRRTTYLDEGDATWFAPQRADVDATEEAPDWETAQAFGVAFDDVVILVNFSGHEVSFSLPAGAWKVAATTAPGNPGTAKSVTALRRTAPDSGAS